MSSIRICESAFRLSSPPTCLQAFCCSSSSSSLSSPSIDSFIGDADGNMFLLSFNAEESSRGETECQRVDLKSHLDKWRRRRRRHLKGIGSGDGGEPIFDSDVVPGCDFLAMEKIDDRRILVALSSALILFDVSINECIAAASFGDTISSSSSTRGSKSEEETLTFPLSSASSLSKSSSAVYAAMVATFSGQITLLRFKIPSLFQTSSHLAPKLRQNAAALEPIVMNGADRKSVDPALEEEREKDEFHFPDLSVVATEALAEDSALKTPPLLPNSEDVDSSSGKKVTASSSSSARSSKPGVKKSASVDLPVIHRDKIKSSGYSVAPRNLKMFQPNTNFSSVKRSSSATSKTKTKSVSQQQRQTRATDSFPSEAPPPSAVTREILLSESRATPVSALSVSSCGANVACGVTDYNITIVGESLTEKSVTSHTGHKGVIHVANWSHDGAWLVGDPKSISTGIESFALLKTKGQG